MRKLYIKFDLQALNLNEPKLELNRMIFYDYLYFMELKVLKLTQLKIYKTSIIITKIKFFNLFLILLKYFQLNYMIVKSFKCFIYNPVPQTIIKNFLYFFKASFKVLQLKFQFISIKLILFHFILIPQYYLNFIYFL